MQNARYPLTRPLSPEGEGRGEKEGRRGSDGSIKQSRLVCACTDQLMEPVVYNRWISRCSMALATQAIRFSPSTGFRR